MRVKNKSLATVVTNADLATAVHVIDADSVLKLDLLALRSLLPLLILGTGAGTG
jgi:hypothetical protein